MTLKVAELKKYYPTTNRTLTLLRQLYGDWNWSLSGGYIRYHLGDSPYLYEHRLVAEVLYGRQSEKYHVHHKDGCGTNNDPANLEVLDPSSHAKIHLLSGRKRHSPVMRSCAQCGAIVEREPSKGNRYAQVYCNRACYDEYRKGNGRGTKPPERERLAELLKSHNRQEIAEMFGCLKYTVSRWITRYGLAGTQKANRL